ncbi:MAG: transcriptional regulator [Proteobacteria bacterium]|nr:transcriptional regulator [Pseudomonadota bacterium]
MALKHAVIKKYPNRRLYDTANSTYVTLKQVGDMIRQGTIVEVRDVGTDEDVTSFILTQIVLEEAKQKNILLPSPLLHLIIQYGDNVLSEFFETYLQQVIKSYISQKTVFDNQFKKMLDFGFDVSEMAQKNIEDFTPFKTFFDLFAATGKKGGNK